MSKEAGGPYLHDSGAAPDAAAADLNAAETERRCFGSSFMAVQVYAGHELQMHGNLCMWQDACA